MQSNLMKDIFYREGGILSKVVNKTAHKDVTLFSMAAGTSISEHTATREGFVLVLEGKGTFTLEGKPIEMVPGVIIFLEANAVHKLHADENTSFLLTLIQ